MKSLHIRSVDARTIEALKRQARSHQRSLQGELRAILDRAARTAPPPAQEPDLSLITVETGRTRSWRREDMYGDQGR